MGTVHITVVTLFFIAFIIDTDAFHLMPVIILAGNTVDTGAVQILYPIDFGIELTDGFCNIAVNRCAVLQCAVNNGRKFIAGHGTVTLELSIRIPFQKTSVCQ